METTKSNNKEGLSVRVATSFDALRQWGAAYQRFLREIGDYGVFYDLGWLESLWPAYALKPGSLFFIGVWRGEELIALAPFQRLQKGPLQGWRRVLVFVGTYHPTLVNPWPDILVARGESLTDCIRALDQELSGRSDWDEIDLNHGMEQSENVSLLKRAWPNARFAPHPNRSIQVELNEGYEGYFASLSGNSRNQLRRNRRRLNEEVKADFVCSTDLPAARWAAIEEMHYQRQHRLQLQGRKDRYSIYGNEVEANALRSALDWPRQQGCARHYWLDIDGTTSAFCLGMYQQQTYFYYFIGIDERAEQYSGGMLLLWHLIEAEANGGTRLIDLMQGVNRLK